jgi:predicted MFS family arabinose efflux permease
LGFLVDRSKPVFIILIASGIITIVPVLKYFFLHSFSAWIMFGFLTVPVMALFAAAELPFHVSVLPKDRYGQFGSANQIVCSIATIAGSLAAGQFMDLATQGGAKVSGYRLLFVWDCFFQILAFLFMFLFYLSWRKHGGPLHYVPPETSRH